MQDRLLQLFSLAAERTLRPVTPIPIPALYHTLAAERLPAALAMYPDRVPEPDVGVPSGVRTQWSAPEARVAAVRGLLEVCGPVTAAHVAQLLSLTAGQAAAGR